MEGNTRSGVYRIYPFVNNTRKSIQVYCDFETSGGGWTVILRREEMGGPMMRFNRGWEDYVVGFGFLNYSHWLEWTLIPTVVLGLDNMAALTSGMDQELIVDMLDWEGEALTSAYGKFFVGSNRTDYHLVTTNYNNETSSGEIFQLPNNRMTSTPFYFGFSTLDHEYRDINRGIRLTCATQRYAAWWYSDRCFGPNFNGIYIAEGGNASEGINWDIQGKRHPLKFVEMKIRNRNYPNGCMKPKKTKKSVESKSSSRNLRKAQI